MPLVSRRDRNEVEKGEIFSALKNSFIRHFLIVIWRLDDTQKFIHKKPSENTRLPKTVPQIQGKPGRKRVIGPNRISLTDITHIQNAEIPVTLCPIISV